LGKGRTSRFFSEQTVTHTRRIEETYWGNPLCTKAILHWKLTSVCQIMKEGILLRKKKRGIGHIPLLGIRRQRPRKRKERDFRETARYDLDWNRATFTSKEGSSLRRRVGRANVSQAKRTSRGKKVRANKLSTSSALATRS